MKNTIIVFILIYRRYISPFKGYKCAHHHLYGDGSCSDWSLKVINTYGLFYFINHFHNRLIECHEASEEVKGQNEDGNSNQENSDKCCIPIEVTGCFISWW